MLVNPVFELQTYVRFRRFILQAILAVALLRGSSGKLTGLVGTLASGDCGLRLFGSIAIIFLLFSMRACRIVANASFLSFARLHYGHPLTCNGEPFLSVAPCACCRRRSGAQPLPPRLCSFEVAVNAKSLQRQLLRATQFSFTYIICLHQGCGREREMREQMRRL